MCVCVATFCISLLQVLPVGSVVAGDGEEEEEEEEKVKGGESQENEDVEMSKEEKKLAIMMMSKKRRWLYNRIMSKQHKRAQRVS